MPFKDIGDGTIELMVSSVEFIPEHTLPPAYSPDNPNPPAEVVPDKVDVKLTPVNAPDSADVMTGSLTINTEQITAFIVGEKYILNVTPAP